LRARCSTAEDAERLLEEVGAPIEQVLGARIFSRNGDPLEAIIGSLLREKHATLSIAESCTGGMVEERITSVAGSSDYFLGGFVVYSDRMKTELLGVAAALLAEHTSVSDEAARAMADGARTRTGATFAISITGEAGPVSSTGAPVGTVFVGFAGPNGPAHARKFAMPGDRPRVRGFATQAALDLLRRRLLAID
jgi:nicotinamide-nucleotide amidase